MATTNGTTAFPFAPGELVLCEHGPHVLDGRGERVATIRTERGVARGMALARGIVGLSGLILAAGHTLASITAAARSRFPVINTCLRTPGSLRGRCGACDYCVLAKAAGEATNGRAG